MVKELVEVGVSVAVIVEEEVGTCWLVACLEVLASVLVGSMGITA